MTSSMVSLFASEVSVHPVPMSMIQSSLLLVKYSLLSLLLGT